MARTLADKIKTACARWPESPAASVAALAGLAANSAGNVDDTLAVLEELIPRKEWYNRITRKQMPYHVASLDELFFHYAKPELQTYLKLTEATMKGPSVSVQVILRRFMALTAVQDFAQIEKLLPHISGVIGRNIWNTFTARPAFYEALARESDDAIAAGLPQVDYVYDEPGDDPLVYLGCDQTYCVEFAAPLIRSIAAFQPAAPVHLHVMNATAADVQATLESLRPCGVRLSISREDLPAADSADRTVARAYFHAVRFVRLHQLMSRRPRDIWMMDVDALFNRAPRDLFALRGTADVAFRARPGRFELWNQFNASVVGITPTPRALGYLRLVAAYIAHFHRKNALAWGIDQLAMFGVFNFLQQASQAPTVALLDNKAVDYDLQTDGIVWCNSGAAKLSAAAAQDPALARYYEAFNRYADKLAAG